MSSFLYDELLSSGDQTEDANYVALGGAGREVTVIPFTLPASTADLAVTGAGFTPECVVIYGCVTFAANSDFDGLFLHWGVATDPTEQWAMSIMCNDNAAGNPRYSAWAEDRIIYQVSGGALDFAASLQSFDSDGFTLNVDNAPGIGLALVAVCMRGGGAYKAGVDATRTTVGTQTIDAGFVADCVLFGSTGRTSDGEISTDMRFSMGASDDTRQNCDAISGDDVSVFTTARINNGMCLTLTHTDGSGGAIMAEASLIDLDNAGEFELDWTTVDGTAYRFGYLALENAAMDWFTTIEDGNDVEVATPLIDTVGLLTFQTSGIPSEAPSGDGCGNIPDASGWIAGAAIGVSAVGTSGTPERTASVVDVSSPPFSVIQTGRELRIGSFGCFRHECGGFFDARDNMVHTLDVFWPTFMPQIYRRVIQRPGRAQIL